MRVLMMLRDDDTGLCGPYQDWHDNVERLPKKTRDDDAGPFRFQRLRYQRWYAACLLTSRLTVIKNAMGEIDKHCRRA